MRSIEEIKESISITTSDCLLQIKELEIRFKKDISELKATVHRSEADAYSWLSEVHNNE